MQDIRSKAETAIWWTIFRDLREARQGLGLSAPHLNTLAALLSFLKPGDAQMMVFASNRTILERLNGLCERSFQRHVNVLIDRGLIRRQASTNGKRFRFHDSKAYGFDLKPLLDHGPAIAEMATEARAALHSRKLLRLEIFDALARLHMLDAPHDEEADLRRMLRRTMPNIVLAETLADLQNRVSQAELQARPQQPEPLKTPDMSANDSQNVGHYQKTISEDSFDRTVARTQKRYEEPTVVCSEAENKPAARDNPHPPENQNIAAWLGISTKTYLKAIACRGFAQVARTLAAILERLDKITNPAAYFYTALIAGPTAQNMWPKG